MLSDTLKRSVIEIIYSEAARTRKPFFCIVDDTIASKTKPSSQALHPIEDAYFHQSHLKGKQDYGHQAVSVMLSCNGIVLNYAFVLYNKAISKIDIVQDIARELPTPPVKSYFLWCSVPNRPPRLLPDIHDMLHYQADYSNANPAGCSK